KPKLLVVDIRRVELACQVATGSVPEVLVAARSNNPPLSTWIRALLVTRGSGLLALPEGGRRGPWTRRSVPGPSNTVTELVVLCVTVAPASTTTWSMLKPPVVIVTFAPLRTVILPLALVGWLPVQSTQSLPSKRCQVVVPFQLPVT